MGPISAARSYAEFSEQRNQEILERKIIIRLDPTHSRARIIGRRQSGGDATALFKQIDLRTRCQINPVQELIVSKPRNLDQFTLVPGGEKGMPRGVELDTWKTKIERFVPARFSIASIG
jgi:hypothetical protein